MLVRIALFVLLFVSFGQAVALEHKTFCIYDPVGRNGPSMTLLADLVPKGITWGIKVELKAYTDEKVASNDFKAGICDVAFLTGILTRQFVPFGGTLNAMGGIMSEEGVNRVMKAISHPKVGKHLIQGRYEIVASFPVGGVYVFVKDRAIDSIEAFGGKKISVLNEDPQVLKLANLAGASPVGTSLATLSGQFNNGNLDLLPMVPIGYNVFELYQGLGDSGGIIDEKLFYGMMQLIAHRDRFDDDFGQNMREYFLTRLADIHKLAKDARDEIPARYWIKTDEKTKAAFDNVKRDIRIAMRDEGLYDSKALKMLWKIRCSEDPTRAECTAPE
ncbi:MAG: putative solute-binding protein [Oleiphilaceae bacterium]|nr:putative solute-binding protein [Oleiphilaceae bacterium]